MLIPAAGLSVELQIHNKDTSAWFADYALACPVPPAAVCSVPPEVITERQQYYEPGAAPAYVEYLELAPVCSDALLSRNVFVIHGAAFYYRGYAWILTAPPGTGKSTQYLNWKLLLGEKIRAMNGDKPFLSITGQGINVHPSPWRGKENIGCDISAPLGGIIYLAQAKENSIRRLPPNEAAKYLYTQILFHPDSETLISAAVCAASAMGSSVPVWELRNLGDLASAELSIQTVDDYIAACKEEE